MLITDSVRRVGMHSVSSARTSTPLTNVVQWVPGTRRMRLCVVGAPLTHPSSWLCFHALRISCIIKCEMT